MLAALRTMQRVFAGTVLVLLASAWLSQAAAACIDIAQASMTHASTDSTMDHDSMDHASMDPAPTGDMPAGHDCPHCAQATLPCMDAAGDCGIDPALLTANRELPKFIALPELPRIGYPVVIRRELPLPHFLSPPCPAGRDLLARFCTLQE